MKVARGNFETRNRVRKSGKNRAGRGAAGNGFVEHGAPTGQAIALGIQVARLVGDVVHKTHKSVKGAQRVALFLAQAEEGEIEAAARFSGDARAFGVGRGDGFGIGAHDGDGGGSRSPEA